MYIAKAFPSAFMGRCKEINAETGSSSMRMNQLTVFVLALSWHTLME